MSTEIVLSCDEREVIVDYISTVKKIKKLKRLGFFETTKISNRRQFESQHSFIFSSQKLFLKIIVICGTKYCYVKKQAVYDDKKMSVKDLETLIKKSRD